MPVCAPTQACTARRGSPSWTSAGHPRNELSPCAVHRLGIVQYSSICNFTKTGIRHRVHIVCDCSTGLQSSPGVALPRRGASHTVDPARHNKTARRREIKGSFARTAHRLLTLTFTSVGHPECVLGTARWRLRRATARRSGASRAAGHL